MPAHEGEQRGPDSSTETALQASATTSDPTARFTPGTMLAGRYRLVAPLGKGGSP